MSEIIFCSTLMKSIYTGPSLIVFLYLSQLSSRESIFLISLAFTLYVVSNRLYRRFDTTRLVSDDTNKKLLVEIGATVCHDVNNPLAIISGFNDQLTIRLGDEQSIPEEFRAYLIKHIRATEASINRISKTTKAVRQMTLNKDSGFSVRNQYDHNLKQNI